MREITIQARQSGKTHQMLSEVPLGTKAPSGIGGHWTKVEGGWQALGGDTFPRPGGAWTGQLIIPQSQS